MTRTATPSFDSLDPDVLEAARDVARRAGVPLETWIASVVPPAGTVERRRRRRAAPEAASGGLQPAAEIRPDDLIVPPEAPSPSPVAAPADDRFAKTLDALMARLDGLDRAFGEERQSIQDAAARRMTEIETRIGEALGSGTGPVQQVTERLGDIERRMSQLGEQLAASRPLGRRGRPAVAEVRDAVEEIRQRQRELSEGGTAPVGAEGGIVASMRQDLARRLDATVQEAVPSAAVSELQRETARLREMIGHLATGRDVGALEQAVISLATGVERVEASTDLTAIAGPIEVIRVQVERLAEDVAENVHTRVAGDVERLAAHLDTVAAAGPGTPPDRDALASVFGELDEIRRLIAALAGPERIQSLAQGLQAVSGQIAQLQSAATDGDATGLRPLLEEIRSGLTAPAPAALTEQIRAMAAKVDALHARSGEADNADSRAILGRIDALAQKVDRVSVHPVGDLIGRLEGLGESLRQPAVPGGDVASIHAMLHNLAEKVDRVGSRPDGDGLDALERQVMTLAGRIDARGSDPALTGLERTMGDLLTQVTALREEGPREAAHGAADKSEFGLIRAGLADIQARQSASDERLSATLTGVQSALDRLVGRLGPADGESVRAAAAARAPSLDERLMASTGIEAPRARPGRRPEAPRTGAEPSVDGGRFSDELLEPGAGRPAQEPPARGRAGHERIARETARETAKESGEGAGDIKTNFIAAARRAAQAAQVELATESTTSERREPRGTRKAGPAATPAADGRLARFRAEIDRRRRPLLLGLAAIVLVLGALQAVSMRSSGNEPAEPAPVAAVKASPPAADAGPAARPETGNAAPAPVEAAKPALPDPQTTQAISPAAAPARPAPAKAAVPQVSSMGGLAADLAGIPTGLSKLKQSVLDGDGTAIWELAGREADGRGLPRDLALAAKLYEKLASAGYAPAQYKLAGHYEKGSGLARDIAQAKLWYGRAAEQGHARSMHNLAVLYAENPSATGKPDYASAASWFRQGAEAGVRDSQYNLAVLYARGLGLTQDLVQSYAWFSAASAQGDEDAGRKRDDVAAKLAPADLAGAKALAAGFKARKLDPAVNEPPVVKDATPPAMSLLGAPAPTANVFAPAARKNI
ncbi:hypothetical protein [Methylobacterium trifolii]|uniref:Localization factor PodJL n=1 Tax=Methylobacterium trifolii TaxID=1003092 RepID=A0ABQ4TW34_9HYPH|nr:hypothetical protein [Methylobacterium trifolii]GJE59476.1 hypothetical protein MPOCJGCO_1569 [Methylobacterium trifolii]